MSWQAVTTQRPGGYSWRAVTAQPPCGYSWRAVTAQPPYGYSSGSGAQFAAFAVSRPHHFFQTAGSWSSRRNTPPTTDRAWNPTFVASCVQYQSVMGTRCGVVFRKSNTGSTSAAKSSGWPVKVAVQVIQSSFVYSRRLSRGRPKRCWTVR